MANYPEPSDKQRAALALLRRTLAEHSYLIAPIATEHRRHESDFIAIPQTAPRQLVAVRCTKSGNIVVRPFGAAHHGLRELMKKVAAASRVSIRWGLPQLTYPSAGPDWRLSFIPANVAEDLRLLRYVE